MTIIINITYVDTPKQRFLPMYEGLGVKLYPVVRTVTL